MAKKTFGAGVTKTGVLNNSGGDKIKEVQAKSQYNFQYIPKERIHSNPKNEKYNQDGIESLMESILVNGLRHNLSVLYDADTDTYRLISGERRYHAICMMTEKEYSTLFPMGIPCKVEKSSIDEIDEEIMLISANHDVREASMEVKRWEVSRLKELYEAKKLTGEIKNINAEIAKQLNISERQARKYTTADKLIPELSDLLNKNNIDLNQADKFGRLDEDAQYKILEIVKKNGSVDNTEYQSIKKISEERAAEAKKYKEELDLAMKQISEKEDTVRFLEERITKLEQNTPSSNAKSRQDLEEELKYITEAKNKAEKERAKLETNIEKLKQQQKEKDERKIDITDVELKKITSLAKAEQALNLFETNFDVLKNNKTIIKNDPNLKVRVEILRSRLNDFIDSLDV
jgi:ParB family chromosome partitioning protein